jgi:hypothetical protein
MLRKFLSIADEERASRTLDKLARHDISRWSLTGGLAIEIHRVLFGCAVRLRALNDIDFAVESFDHIPKTLVEDFLFRHVHPLDPTGKNMMQMVDVDTAVRTDIFRASGATMSRTTQVELSLGSIRVVSPEDLTARATRLALDLADGVATPAKYPRDFLALVELVDTAQVEVAWQNHRKIKHPPTFEEAKRLLQILIASHPELLITPSYSHDTEEVCPRCLETADFPLANAKTVLQVLGYC